MKLPHHMKVWAMLVTVVLVGCANLLRSTTPTPTRSRRSPAFSPPLKSSAIAARGNNEAVAKASSKSETRVARGHAPRPRATGNVHVDDGHAPSWSVAGERAKQGAGLLFFSYGGSSTLAHFLHEAEQAARSFRDHNPGISIAIVTNAEAVDRAVFDIVIAPRADLLFRGASDRADKLPRQWLTRLIYLAHSPYLITWALDSNVISCTPHAASSFLHAALATNMWGYHVAHASQRLSDPMYPHNFNIIYRWCELTSSVLREWLLLQLRQGVATDDQSSLHLAELRFAHARSGLRVGHLATPFGAALQPLHLGPNSTLRPDMSPRLTAVITGRAHVLHATNASLCQTFNAELAPRQLLEVRVGREMRRELGPPGRKTPAAYYNRSIFHISSLSGRAACEARLGADRRYCLVPAEAAAAALLVARAHAGPRRTADGTAALGGARRANNDESAARLDAVSAPFMTRAHLETLEDYIASARCGRQCEDLEALEPPPQPPEALGETQCHPLRGRRLQFLDRHRVSCAAGHALRGFGLGFGGAHCHEAGTGAGKMRMGFACVHLGAGAEHARTALTRTPCAPMRDEKLQAMARQRVGCGQGAGWALKGFWLTAEGCAEKGSRYMRFAVECIEMRTSARLPPGSGDSVERGGAGGATEHRPGGAASGSAGGALPSLRPSEPPPVLSYEGASLCAPAVGETCEALQEHQVACAPRTHLLAGWGFVGAPCAAVEGSGGATSRWPMQMRMEYRCVPLPREPREPPRTGHGRWYLATQENPL